jgi:hypothetical protein
MSESGIVTEKAYYTKKIKTKFNAMQPQTSQTTLKATGAKHTGITTPTEREALFL